MADKFGSGFLRDDQGRLVITPQGAKEGWVSGFVRDEEGALVVVGPGGEPISDSGEAAALVSQHVAALDPHGDREKLGGVYRFLHSGIARATISGVSGKKYWFHVTPESETPSVTNNMPVKLLLKATDLAIPNLTTKLRLTASVFATTASGLTVTVGLYPVETSGSGQKLGTVVPGSTVELVTPTNDKVRGTTADFALPADGEYQPGYTLSGTPGASIVMDAVVHCHNVP